MDIKKRFSHNSLSNMVVQYLKEEIFLENYKEGDRILEAQIAEELDISRAPVREAIKELENQGLVETIPRKGTFVIQLSQKDIQELFNIRIMLENRLLEKIINEDLLDEEDFKYLEGLVQDMIKTAESTEDENRKVLEVNKRDVAFHHHLWKKSESKWTIKILTGLYFQLQLAMLIDAKKEENLVQSAKQHFNIIKSLQEKDCKKAKESLRNHIITLSQRVESCS